MSNILHVQRVAKQGYFSSVADAIEAATPNTTISIGAGTYIETELPINKPGIKFVAEGDGTPVIQAHGIGLMISSTVSFSGIQFVSDDPASPAVVVVGGTPSFVKCTFQSLFVDVDGAPTVQHCTFSGSPMSGLTISGAAGGQYKNNVFKMNRIYSILIDTNGSPVIQASQFAQAGHGTICVCGSRSTPLLKMNNIQDSSTPSSMRSGMDDTDVVPATISCRAGVIVANGAAPTLESNTIFAGEEHGVAVFGKGWSPARLQGKEPPATDSVRKTKNTHTDTGVVNLVRNTLRDNNGTAVFATNPGVRVVLESNSIEENNGGVAVSGGAVMNLKNDTLRANQLFGAKSSGSHSGLILQQCTVLESKYGAMATDAGMLKLINCIIERTENATTSSSRGAMEIDRCTINNNDTGAVIEEFGVLSGSNSSFHSNSVGALARSNGIPQLSKCTFRRNTTSIQCTTGSRGVFSECIITESANAQIVVSDRGNSKFLKNEIRDAECCAVLIKHRGFGEFNENTITGHKATTIKLEFGGDPQFIDNIITNGTAEGVLVDRGSTGSFVGNSIRDFKSSSGVVVRSGCEPTFRCNKIEGNSLAGIDVQQGAKGIYEKNQIISNSKTAVNLTGSGNVFATVAKNTLRESPVGVLASDSARSLIISNDICRCQIGVAGTSRSSMNCIGNKVYENRIGILVTDASTKGYIVANRIHRNFDAGIVIRNEASPMVSKNTLCYHFEEDDDTGVATATTSASGKIKPHPAVPAILLKEGCGGKLINNTIIHNSVGIEAHCCKTQLYSNLISKNRCGVWSKNHDELMDIRSTRNSVEYIQYVIASTESGAFENSDEDDVETKITESNAFITSLRIRHCTFAENGIGLSCCNAAKTLVEFCTFTENQVAGISVTGATVTVQVSLSTFIVNGNNSIYASGSTTQESSAHFDRCLFNGKDAPFVCTKKRGDIEVLNSVFACCPVEVSGEAHPSFYNTSHTGYTQALAASVDCAEDQFVEFVNESECRPTKSFSVSGALALKQNRLVINIWSFPLDQCIRVFANGRGSFQKCSVSFADEGVHLEKTEAVLNDCAFYRCKTSGINISPGFTGQIDGCAFFENYGCGIRVVGKMLPPAKISNATIFANRVVSLSRGATSPTARNKFSTEESTTLLLPDISEDTPYSGQEKDVRQKVEAPVPRYTCPSSDGPGIGVYVEASGCIVLQDSEIFASGLSNMMVTSKIKSVIETTKFYSSDGYGLVTRQGGLVECKQCYFLDNAYSGVLCENNALPSFDGCTFSGNTIGAMLSGDKSSLSKSRFIGNNVCGIRAIDGSQANVVDCDVSQCGCGIECRAPVSTTPTLSNCDIHENRYAGVLCSGYSRPTIRECSIRLQEEVAGIAIRCYSLATVQGCSVEANKVGILCRMSGEVEAHDSTIATNNIGITVEFGGGGVVKRSLSTGNKQQSVLCRTQGNITFAENIFASDAPALITMEGLSTFSHNTFRTPLSSCFLIQRGGDPTISHSRFQVLHTPSSDLALLRLQQTGSKRKSDPTSPLSDEARRRTSSLRRKTLEVRPSSSEMEKRRRRSYVALAKRRGTINNNASEDSVKIIDAALMMEASQIVEEECAAIDRLIPIKIELGGKGLIQNCLFAHNRPCSVLVDGATSEPTIENNVFYDHLQSALVLSNGCTPNMNANLFYKNNLGVQLSTTSSPVDNCVFILNDTGIECGTSCGSEVNNCTFIDDNLGVNCLEGATASIDESKFFRCDTCCFFDDGSASKFVKNKCYHSGKSGVTTESDSAMQLVGSSTFIGGAAGVLVGTNGMLRIAETEIVDCSGPGIAFHSDSGQTSKDAAQGSASQCTVQGCGSGLSVSGHGTTPMVQDCIFGYCESGVEVRNHANPTIQLSKILQNNLGLFVHSNALGTFKRIQVIANATGVKISTGTTDSPSVSHCNILDSADVGMVLEGDAGGEVADCNIFDNDTGLLCADRASTKVDFTSISHALSEARAKDKAVKRSSTQQKVQLGPNVKVKYDHAPPYNQLNARLRGLEQAKAKSLFQSRVETLHDEIHQEEEECREQVNKTLLVFGHSLDQMQTVKEASPNELDAIIGNHETTQQLSVAPPKVLRDLSTTIPNVVSPDETEASEATSQCDESPFSEDDKPFSDYELSTTPTRKRKKKVKSAKNGKVRLPKVREVKKKTRAAHPPSKPQALRKSIRSRLSVFGSTDSRLDEPSYGSLNATQLLNLTGRKPSQAAESCSIEDIKSVRHVSSFKIESTPPGDELESGLTIPFLPQLPTLPPSASAKPYPRRRVEVPTQTTSDAETLLPPLMPRQPSLLSLTCLNHPQHGKFKYSTAMHTSLVELSKDYNSLFADQVLQAFRDTDRRQQEAITVPDLARFVEKICELYRFHPGKAEAARRATAVQISTRTNSVCDSAQPASLGDSVNSEVFVKSDRNSTEPNGAPHHRMMSIAQPVSPFTPLPQFSLEFARNTFKELFDKDPETDQLDVHEFCRFLIYEGSVMAPLFQLHFTWMLKNQPTIADSSELYVDGSLGRSWKRPKGATL